MEATKRAYKALLSVQKSAQQEGKVEVVSTVYRVRLLETEEGGQLFPCASPNNFCYVIVDPQRRLARVWYHAFVPFW